MNLDTLNPTLSVKIQNNIYEVSLSVYDSQWVIWYNYISCLQLALILIGQSQCLDHYFTYIFNITLGGYSISGSYISKSLSQR